MKTTSFSSFGLAIVSALLLLLPSHIAASNAAMVVQYAPFVTFHGASNSTSAYGGVGSGCSAAETALIAKEIDRAYNASLSLTSSKEEDEDEDEDDEENDRRRLRRRLVQGQPRRNRHDRSLQLFKCMPLMAWASQKCGGAIPRRRRRRRQLDEDEVELDDDDESELEDYSEVEYEGEYEGDDVDAAEGDEEDDQDDEDDEDEDENHVYGHGGNCARDTAKFDAALTAVESQLSPSCRAFTQARTFTCREVLDCDIANITYWNGNRVGLYGMDTKLIQPRICQGTRIDFEAVTAFDVGHVQFTLAGDSNGYHYTSQDFEAPYFLFGNSTTPQGQALRTGYYTFTAVVADEAAKPTSFRFRVRSCS